MFNSKVSDTFKLQFAMKSLKDLVCMKTNWYRLIRLVYTIHFVPLVLGYIKHVRKMVLCCLFTALYCRVSIDDFEYVSKCCQFRFMDWQLAAAYSFLFLQSLLIKCIFAAQFYWISVKVYVKFQFSFQDYHSVYS